MMKKVIVLLIGFVPFNVLRVFLYKTLLNYKLNYNCRIGMFNYIYCDELLMNNSEISNLNRISCKILTMDSCSKIGRLNNIKFVRRVNLSANSIVRTKINIIGTSNYLSPYCDAFEFSLGQNSLLTSKHYMDCSGKISIGANVVFGGVGSEIWTHGFDNKRTMIVGNVCIGDNIYIGSRALIVQNVSICDNVSIGAGTIVSKNIVESGFYISSHLIRKSDLADYSKSTNLIEYEGANFVRK